jgi:hypothetical protein
VPVLRKVNAFLLDALNNARITRGWTQSSYLPLAFEAGIEAIDPITGEATLVDVVLLVDIDIGQTGDGDCRLTVDVDTTTGTSGDITRSPLNQDGQMSLVDGLFEIPAAAPTSAVGLVLCGLVNDAIGLPSGPGGNALQFDLLVTQP